MPDPAEQVQNPTAPGSPEPVPAAPAAPPAAPAGTEPPVVAASDPVKELRDRLAQAGRERAAAEARAAQAQQQAQALQSQLQQLQTQVQEIGSTLTVQQQRQQEAYLASLPPDRRVEARIQLLEQRIAGAQRQPTQPQAVTPPVPQRTSITDEEIRAHQQRLLDQVKQETGVALDISDEALDARNPEVYLASARALARAMAKQTPQEAPVVKDEKAASAVDVAAIKNEIAEEIYRELGVARPNSPAAAAGSGTVTSESIQTVLKSAKPASGQRAKLEQLRQIREQAATAS